MPETVDIFKNKKTGQFLIQRKCPHPELRGPTSIGEPETLSEQQLRRLGVSKLVEALESSSRPCSDPKQIKDSTDEKDGKFLGLHHCLTLARWPDTGGQLELYPLRQVRGGYRSIKGAKRVIAVDDIQVRLIDEILSAFKAIEDE